MKVLITGSLGFVGRYFTHTLKDRKHQILSIDLKQGLDCRDFFKIDTSKFDLVIHLAAIVGGREKIEQEPLAVATDLSIDSEMFNWALRTKQKRIVYFSSSAAYPIELQTGNQRIKLSENLIDLDNIRNPDNTYGWAKLSGELLASHARKLGLKVHVFRPFSGYGHDQDMSYPFPSFLKRVLTKPQKFEIWGDGNQVRDFIHIQDIVDATMTCVEQDIEETINLGCGRPTSFNQLAELFFQASGWRPKQGISHLLKKPVGVNYRCSNNQKMLDIYTPKISLEEGIQIALKEYGY